MSEYNSSASKEFMEYTKKEALQRYSVVWAQLRKTLSMEDAVDKVKKKLSALKGKKIEIGAALHEREGSVEKETAPEKGDDSFIGAPDLSIEGLFTQSMEGMEAESTGHAEEGERREDTQERCSSQRTSKLVVDDSEESSGESSHDSTCTESEEFMSSNSIADEISEISSHHVVEEALLFPEKNVQEDAPEKNTGMEFNPEGVKKVKTTQTFRWGQMQ
ncbi:uncharacterized protein NEMAJ01_1929 [Nematocida major]|uniref:uncharacterized protein n=1 Tax=Nematocida major TaxID=1912982 RepID=UPI002008C1E7|nr:uncharacterized protein NEMAJ01_1929 [Nematocida major]KAH9387033.1 hypothetical protein NEMAJ01_1929 [Nematocida major]